MKLGDDILWLSEADVRSLLTMPEALEAIEHVFRLHGQGAVQLPSKIYLDFDPYGGDLRAMPAYVKGSHPSAGVKIVNSNANNPRRGLPAVSGIMVFNDPKSGLPLAVFAAGNLTSIRTGAAGGVAAKYLARPNSTSVGLVGCGKQAFTQLMALCEIFSIKDCHVWGLTTKETNDFIKLASKKIPVNFHAANDVRSACQVDILVTTTPVVKPLVKAHWIQPGTHINAIGADAPGKQELETMLLKKSQGCCG